MDIHFVVFVEHAVVLGDLVYLLYCILGETFFAIRRHFKCQCTKNAVILHPALPLEKLLPPPNIHKHCGLKPSEALDDR
jgi:hypothetical protein